MRDAIVGEHITDATYLDGSFQRRARVAEVVRRNQPPGYTVGTLEEARVAFEKATGLTPDWDEPDIDP